MEPQLRRSTDVTGVLTVPSTARQPDVALNFDALYRDARDDLFAYVATLLRDRAASEDVTATAFERAYRRQKSFDPRRGSERGWLFGIARNAALVELRRRRRQAALTAEPEDIGAGDVPEDAAEQALRRAAAQTALATLAPREREVIALKFHAGLDNAELAAVLGVSVSNAGTLLHRAITKVRKAVDAHA
jgi:RNA polymerase sigma-70 factor (ECF subfamily)